MTAAPTARTGGTAFGPKLHAPSLAFRRKPFRRCRIPAYLQAQGLGDMSMLASIEGRVRSALGLVHSKLSVA